MQALCFQECNCYSYVRIMIAEYCNMIISEEVHAILFPLLLSAKISKSIFGVSSSSCDRKYDGSIGRFLIIFSVVANNDSLLVSTCLG